MKPELFVWVLYFDPKDHPGKWVARLFQGETPTARAYVGDSRAEVEAQLPHGLAFITRDPNDEPQIVGTYF